MDEVFITINDVRHYLWRAVDQDDDAIDILVQKRRNKRATKRFFRKLMKGQGFSPRRMTTDKLRRAARVRDLRCRVCGGAISVGCLTALCASPGAG